MTERLADPMQSSGSKLGSMRAVVEGILRIFAGCAAVIKPTKYSPQATADVDDQRAEGPVEESAAVANSTTAKAFDVLITADVKVGAEDQIDSAVPIALDQEEIQRRRNLVRKFFNDFWSESHEKPSAFVERLDQAEDYLNERLAASGEVWRLDAKTRVMLSLPSRSNSLQDAKDRALLVAERSFGHEGV
jgi:hypothetical protein